MSVVYSLQYTQCDNTATLKCYAEGTDYWTEHAWLHQNANDTKCKFVYSVLHNFMWLLLIWLAGNHRCHSYNEVFLLCKWWFVWSQILQPLTSFPLYLYNMQKCTLALSWQLIQSTLLPFSSEDKVSGRHCDMQRQATFTDVFPTALDLLVSCSHWACIMCSCCSLWIVLYSSRLL